MTDLYVSLYLIHKLEAGIAGCRATSPELVLPPGIAQARRMAALDGVLVK